MKKHTLPRVAIVHDSIRFYGGAERVLAALHQTFPEAHIYTSVISWEDIRPFKKIVEKMNITTSWAQYILFFRKYPFLFRYLLPFIWRSFDLSSYDIVISSSGAQMSHLIRKGSNAIHICYCHTPPRHLYGYATDYPWEQIWIIRYACRLLNYFLRIFSEKAVKNIDYFIANSQETKRRIKKFYKRDSIIIFPPSHLSLKRRKKNKPGSYYLSVSRLSRMKHVDLVIQVMNTLKEPLHIVGAGPQEKYLKRIAGETITFLGQISDEALVHQYEGCKALICAAEDEDFGITPLEAAQCGKPVIAYHSGGYKETVFSASGVFFYTLTLKAMKSAVVESQHILFHSKTIVNSVRHYSVGQFSKKIKVFVMGHFLKKDT